MKMEFLNKKEKNSEITVGENRLYLGQDNILYINIAENTAMVIKEACVILEKKIKEKADVLVDINKSDKTSLEAKKYSEN